MKRNRVYKKSIHSLFFRTALSLLTVVSPALGSAAAQENEPDKRVYIGGFNKVGATSPFFHADIPDDNETCESMATRLIEANVLKIGPHEYLRVKCGYNSRGASDGNETDWSHFDVLVCSKGLLNTKCSPWNPSLPSNLAWEVTDIVVMLNDVVRAAMIEEMIRGSLPDGKKLPSLPQFDPNQSTRKLEL